MSFQFFSAFWYCFRERGGGCDSYTCFYQVSVNKNSSVNSGSQLCCALIDIIVLASLFHLLIVKYVVFLWLFHVYQCDYCILKSVERDDPERELCHVFAVSFVNEFVLDS